MRLGSTKIKNKFFFLPLRSAFTTFDFVEDRMRLGSTKIKNKFFFLPLRSAFTTFALILYIIR